MQYLHNDAGCQGSVVGGGTQLHLKATWRKCHLTWVLKHEVKLHKQGGTCANIYSLREWLRIEYSRIKLYFRKTAGELGREQSLIATTRTLCFIVDTKEFDCFLFLTRNMAWSRMRFPTDWLTASESRSSIDPHRKCWGPPQGQNSEGSVKGSRPDKEGEVCPGKWQSRDNAQKWGFNHQTVDVEILWN